MIVSDKKTNKTYYINLDLAKQDQYGLAGYDRPTWGDVNLTEITNMDVELLIRSSSDYENGKSEYLSIKRTYENQNRVMEENLSKYDINAEVPYDEDMASDFYKKANRIYIAPTANSRIALYEYEGKYYLSERRVMITNDGYNAIMIEGYSKKDEFFTEVSEDEIKAIFGKKSSAILNFGKNLDTALLDSTEIERICYSKSGFWTIEDLKLMQQGVTKIPESEVPKQQTQVDSGDLAQLSKEMGITTSEVRENPFTRLWRKIMERVNGNR